MIFVFLHIKIQIKLEFGQKISKRDFFKQSLSGVCGVTFGLSSIKLLGRNMENINLNSEDIEKGLWKWSREAYHYMKLDGSVKCLVCPNSCNLKNGQESICRNKINKNGKLYTIAYGNPCSVHIDPIEKKPLFHYYPGSKIYSIATAGCNFRCLNCQNWTISQVSPKETENVDLMPKEVVDSCISNNCTSIAYTYSEPIAFYEYVYDTAKIARAKGIKNIFIM